MDPFEEFEFKPLTDGLGFQRRKAGDRKTKAEAGEGRQSSREDLGGARVEAPPSLDESSSSAIGKRPTHSKNITDIISSLPSLDVFDDALEGAATQAPSLSPKGEAFTASPSAPSTQAARNTRPVTQLEKPFGGKLSGGGRGGGVVPPTNLSGRQTYGSPKPGSPTVPSVTAMTEMAAASVGDLLGGGDLTPVGMRTPASTGQPNYDIGTAPAFRTPTLRPSPSKAAQPATNQAKAPQYEWVIAKTSMVSLFVDGVMIFGFTLLFLAALLVVTKINLNLILLNLQSDWMTQISSAFLLISVQQLYLILTRSFFASTLGEWAMDLQLGTPKQQAQPSYPLRVALRSLLFCLTGGLVVPILSLFFRKDLGVFFGGLSLGRSISKDTN